MNEELRPDCVRNDASDNLKVAGAALLAIVVCVSAVAFHFYAVAERFHECRAADHSAAYCTLRDLS